MRKANVADNCRVMKEKAAAVGEKIRAVSYMSVRQMEYRLCRMVGIGERRIERYTFNLYLPTPGVSLRASLLTAHLANRCCLTGAKTVRLFETT